MTPDARKLLHEPRNEPRDEGSKICFKYLDLTSRSFTVVIKQLNTELLLPVCIFYLVLRGLDTIEDDPSIPWARKEPLLREFSSRLEQDGWTFTGNRADEADRELLVNFDAVIAEFKKLKPEYRGIITNVTAQMGHGMADYARCEGICSVEQYDDYCWYVAGIVGEGLTGLFVQSGLGDDTLRQEELYRAMGLMLQKNNIIRDVHEDYCQGRRFWPREIWGKHVSCFEDLFDADKRGAALDCSSEMVLDALRHARFCLEYLSRVREASLFRFCAIAQCMAVATLDRCFRNGDVFERKVKVDRGAVLEVLVCAGDMRRVCALYRVHVGRIREKNCALDPNFGKIRDVCHEVCCCGASTLLCHADGHRLFRLRPSSMICRVSLAWILGHGVSLLVGHC
jgi:farnesyl-diphosphate farnesyltransferase